MIFKIRHLECYFNTTVAVVTGVMHEADNVYSIRSTWLCYRLVCILRLAYNGKDYNLKLKLINLLLSFFNLDVSFFYSIASLGVDRSP